MGFKKLFFERIDIPCFFLKKLIQHSNILYLCNRFRTIPAPKTGIVVYGWQLFKKHYGLY